jgi:transcriptional regulator with XRE-family HTH domain
MLAVQVVTLGDRVRALREAQNPPLQAQELSERLHLHKSYVSRLEAGKIALPSVEVLRGLARELGTTAVDLLSAAGYLDSADLDPVAILLDDPEYSVALRTAAGISDHALREMVTRVIRRAAELEAAEREIPGDAERR